MTPDRRGNAAKRVASTTAPPWKTGWKRLSRHGRAIRFIETYCRAPKGKGWGKPVKLYREQKEFLEAALADGVDAAVWEMPRGNGKSTLGGGLMTWALFDDDDTGAPQVPVVGKTLTQGIRSCYGVAAAMIKAEPELERRALIYTGVSQPRVFIPYNNGEMFPIANDPDTLQGLDPSLAIMDEIGFQPPDAWDSLKLAAGKRERSLTLGLGTPGFDTDSALYRLRTTLNEGARIPGFVYREDSAPEDADWTDRDVWRAANPGLRAGILRLSALETDYLTTPEARFRIFRLAQWWDGAVSWLGDDGRAIWEALTNPYELVDGARTWVGIDVGLTQDSTAVVTAQVRPDEEGHPEHRIHLHCRLWVPGNGKPVDVTDVMQYVRDLCDAYKVDAVSYDPRLFDVSAKILEDEGYPMVEVPQSLERMTMAVGDFYAGIMGGTITHDGDPAFTTHIMNAQPRYNERGFTISKRKSTGRIDAAIAAALAVDRVMRAEPWGSVYEDRPMRELG